MMFFIFKVKHLLVTGNNNIDILFTCIIHIMQWQLYILFLFIDNKRHSVSSLSLTNFPHHVSNEIKNISPHRFTNKSQKPSLRHSAPVMHVNSQEYSNLSDIETLKTSDEEEEETYNDAISVGKIPVHLIMVYSSAEFRFLFKFCFQKHVLSVNLQ